MLTKVLIAIGAFIIAFVVLVAMQPSEFRVVRTAAMAGPAPVAFAQVNDFHRWTAWSPWEKIDPALRRRYAGAPAGTGAIYAWAGNAQVGEGRMTITESRPSDLIRIKLEFSRPFTATNTAEFTFKPAGNQTVVTWSMAGKYNFVTKAMGLVMNMDKMMGGQFEAGLAQMKSVVDAASTQERGAESARLDH